MYIYSTYRTYKLYIQYVYTIQVHMSTNSVVMHYAE